MRRLFSSAFTPRFYLTTRRYNQQIIESSDCFSSCVSAILKNSSNSVALFDIDNTLKIILGFQADPLIRKSGYASDSWFFKTTQQLKTNPNHYKDSFSLLLEEYTLALPHLTFSTTEECVSEKMTTLNKYGIPRIGLTSRSSWLKKITEEKLNILGINLDDIIYVNGGSKSAAFKKYLELQHTKQLIGDRNLFFFMDDRKEHCEDMYQFFCAHHYTSIVFHYTHVETKLPIDSDEKMNQDRADLEKKLNITLPLSSLGLFSSPPPIKHRHNPSNEQIPCI